MNKQKTNIDQANKIYDQYVKPVEGEHKDQYVLVTPEGETIYGSS